MVAFLSVVINQIYVDRVLSVECEYNAPVARDRYGELTISFTSQWMKAEAWRIHHCRRTGHVKQREDQLDPSFVLGRHTARTARGEEPFEPLMPEAGYHR
jgi:hypothetical protein